MVVALKGALLGLVWALLAVPGDLRAAEPFATTNDYESKATALYNLLAFTEWPETAFSSADAPLVIAVFGRGQIGGALTGLIKGENWRGRPVMLDLNPSLPSTKTWHVVFVSRTEQERWPYLQKQLAGRPILTVGDADGFARDAGMVQFTLEQGKVRLTVNLAALRAAGLQISSAVLQLATVIGASPE